jgi:hypothetical protein
MPLDPTHPEQLGDAARFRADLVAYLDSLPVSELLKPPGARCRSACSSWR